MGVDVTGVEESTSLESLLAETPTCELEGDACEGEAEWVGRAHCTMRLACTPCKTEAVEFAVWHVANNGFFMCHVCNTIFLRVDWRRL